MSAEYRKKWRNARQELGFCYTCGKHPKRDGRTTCQMCSDGHSKRSLQRKQILIDSGLCNTCFKEKADVGYKSCSTCRSKRNLKSILNKYKLSENDYKQLKDECEICGSKERLHIDHNHATGNVRGRLCYMCNQALGLFKENVQHLYSAIKYLERTNEEPAAAA